MTKASAFGPADLGVIACKHVAAGLRATALVTRYNDGDWSFSSGQTDHAEETEENGDVVVVHIHHVLDCDPSIKQVADLPKGWSAEREGPGKLWRRYPDPA
jgi:hypothetical protein